MEFLDGLLPNDNSIYVVAGTPVYFKPQTNNGVMVGQKSTSAATWVDVLHTIDPSGATAWFRYRMRDQWSYKTPFLIIPVVSSGASGPGGSSAISFLGLG